MVRIISLLLVIVFCSSSILAQEENSHVLASLPDCVCADTSSNTTDFNNNGLKVLQVGREIAIINKEIITGSCWDFVNYVYKKSGAEKTSIFRSKKGGPYAKPEMVKPGDWIYHINYSYKNIEHSAIFVCWKDIEKRIAVTLSYAGGNRKLPGKYGTYNLKGIYSIQRPAEPLN